jgi:hypothetical protein
MLTISGKHQEVEYWLTYHIPGVVSLALQDRSGYSTFVIVITF